MRSVDTVALAYEVVLKLQSSQRSSSDTQGVGLFMLQVALKAAGEGRYEIVGRPDVEDRTLPAPDAVLARNDGHRLLVEVTQIAPLPHQLEQMHNYIRTIGEISLRTRNRLNGSLHVVIPPEIKIAKAERTSVYDDIAADVLEADLALDIGQHRLIRKNFAVAKASHTGSSLAFHDFVPNFRHLYKNNIEPNYRFDLQTSLTGILREAEKKMNRYRDLESVLVIRIRAQATDPDRMLADVTKCRHATSINRLYLFDDLDKPMLRAW